MTREVHDQFAKQYLAELLAPFGNVEISREVTDEPRRIDIWFQSTTTTDATTQLGLLGRLAKKTCLLEPFRNQPSQSEVRNCLLKLFALCAEYQRQAKREKSSLPEADLPQLWLLVTSASTPLLTSLGAKLGTEDWPTGIYFLATVTRSQVVVINQLPVTPETLWLRIMGKGATQKQAIAELMALEPENRLRTTVLDLLFTWRISLEGQRDLTEEETEMIAELQELYVRRREEILRQGIEIGEQRGEQRGIEIGEQRGIEIGEQQGRLAERRFVVANILQLRFGPLDPELAQVIQPILELPAQDYIELLAQLPQLSRQELLAKFPTSP